MFFLIYCNTNTDIVLISQLNLSHCHVLICCRIKWLQLNSLIWTSDKTEKLKFAVIMTRFCFWCVWFTEHTSGPEPLGGNSRETMSDGELQRFGGGFSKSSLMILKTSPKPRRTLSQFKSNRFVLMCQKTVLLLVSIIPVLKGTTTLKMCFLFKLDCCIDSYRSQDGLNAQ